jgi:L-ascorbate metabolism protein UlaG (beta-lactamase superfamily)
MNIEEAIQAAKIFQPTNVIPMHERGKDISEFKSSMKEELPTTNVILLKPFESTEI